MADEGSTQLMAELIRQEKVLQGKLDAIDRALEAPREQLDKARAIVLKAKQAYEQALARVRPLESERVLLQGEIDLLADKKREVRIEARRIQAGGMRPGTQELVRQMHELAGDPGEARLREQAKDAAVDQELAALKAAMASGDGGA